MRVHYDEGIAIHIGPEPCERVREGAGEASAGERIGQPLSHEILTSRALTLFRKRKAIQPDALSQVSGGSAGSKNLACVEAPWAGTGRSLDRPSAFGSHGPWREGEEP